MDLPLAHLDRAFDYLVPMSLADDAVAGARVRVRFAGKDVGGYILERVEVSDHAGSLTPLRRVVSREPVLTADVHRLCRAVADRYAGTLADVLRLAVPPRHAKTEQAPEPAPTTPDGPVPASRSPGGPADGPVAASSSPGGPADGPGPPGSAWADYAAGHAFLARVEAGEGPHAVWTALPGPGWAVALAEAAAAAVRGGRGAVLVLPDRRDVDAVDAALHVALGPGRHVRLEADLGAAARYDAFLALLRGRVPVAVGTRAAAFAPVAGLGLVAIWDDGDDLHAEPRAPYPHAREVLRLRAEQAGAAFLAGSWGRSAESALLLAQGWARPVAATRATVRARWPRVRTTSSSPREDPRATAVHIPTAAWAAIQHGLESGPVLVQVPRVGYVPATACASCRRPARCPTCQGPVRLTSSEPPVRVQGCGWCGRPLNDWACPHCGGHALRASTVGVERTAEELGRAFPGARVVVSRAARTPASLPSGRVLVVATPGVEPVVPDGYAAAVLLDGQTLLDRADLRAAEEAVRRWLAAAARVRPATRGGVVVVAADPLSAPVQALVRIDAPGHADRELAERTELGLPPAVASATLTGEAAAVETFLATFVPPPQATMLGPVPHPAGSGTVRVVVRAPLARQAALSRALAAAAALRSARRDPPVRVRVDPLDLG